MTCISAAKWCEPDKRHRTDRPCRQRRQRHGDGRGSRHGRAAAEAGGAGLSHHPALSLRHLVANREPGREQAVQSSRAWPPAVPPGERAWAYNGWGISISQSARVSGRQGAASAGPSPLIPTIIFSGPTWPSTTIGWGARKGACVALRRRWHCCRRMARTTPRRTASIPRRMATVPSFFFTRATCWRRRNRVVSVNRAGATLFVGSNTGFSVEILAALHEPVAARAALADYPKVPAVIANAGSYSMQLLRARMLAALAEQDWPAVLAAEQDFAPLAAQYPGLAELRPTFFDPSVALALAHMGQFAAAEARLKPMPGDCYPCLRARAQVAALQGQDARADFWFARAAAIAPSSPYAESEWGQVLLARGKPDEAIEQFNIANKKGPHFADPLEGWGEALMAKNQSHLALAKFAEAEKYAPNWGRLHLKWGEALAYSGKKDEAAKQFARAAQLDLTLSDKAELARFRSCLKNLAAKQARPHRTPVDWPWTLPWRKHAPILHCANEVAAFLRNQSAPDRYPKRSSARTIQAVRLATLSQRTVRRSQAGDWRGRHRHCRRPRRRHVEGQPGRGYRGRYLFGAAAIFARRNNWPGCCRRSYEPDRNDPRSRQCLVGGALEGCSPEWRGNQNRNSRNRHLTGTGLAGFADLAGP